MLLIIRVVRGIVGFNFRACEEKAKGRNACFLAAGHSKTALKIGRVSDIPPGVNAGRKWLMMYRAGLHPT
jgi:hypothetical protein